MRRSLPRFLLLFTLLVAAFSLTACAGKNVRGGAPGMPQAGMDNGQTSQFNGDNNPNLAGIPPQLRHLFEDPNNPLSTMIIYFPTNVSDIPSRYTPVIQAHGQFLSQHPDIHLRLEGNTDERGTREYNVALGERRAQSVKQALVLAGASPNQITTISYGEERPAVLGHTAADYAKNRRVVFVYPAPSDQSSDQDQNEGQNQGQNDNQNDSQNSNYGSSNYGSNTGN